MDIKEQQQLLWSLIDEGEKDKALDLLLDSAGETSFKKVIFEILEPSMVEWGKLWMQGKLSLAHGYLVGKIAEELYLKASLSKEFLAAAPQKKGTIILGNIEDDFHPLGRRLVNIFSQTAGWEIIDLGNDVMAETFVEKAQERQAHIIAVSAMMFTTARNIHKVRQELDKRGLTGKVQLAVGGAVFKLRPELVAEIGADGTTTSAIEAPALFDSLWIKSLQTA